MKSETVTTGSVTRATGVSSETLNAWVKASLIRPAVPGAGTGHHARFDVMDVLAVAVAKGLRSRGHSLQAASAVLEVLRGLTEEGLLREFDAGNTCVVLCGDRALDRLRSWDDVSLIAGGPQADAFLVLIDVKAIYHQVREKIDAPVRDRAGVLVG